MTCGPVIEEQVSQRFTRLHYGPRSELIVEKCTDGWCWIEKNNDTGKCVVQNHRFPTFLDTVNDYEAVSRHDSVTYLLRERDNV